MECNGPNGYTDLLSDFPIKGRDTPIAVVYINFYENAPLILTVISYPAKQSLENSAHISLYKPLVWSSHLYFFPIDSPVVKLRVPGSTP